MTMNNEDMRCIAPRGKKWRVRVMIDGAIKTGTFSTILRAQIFRDNAGSEKYSPNKSLTTINERPGFLYQEKKPLSDKLYSMQEIVNSGINIGTFVISGIYFLIKGQTVVYVGQSRDVYLRIKAHRAANIIDFSSVTIIPADYDSLNQLEKRYIQSLMPEHNLVHKESALKIVLAQQLHERDLDQRSTLSEALRFNQRNQDILRRIFYLIKLNNPSTIKELSILCSLETKRVSRILNKMQDFGILYLEKAANYSKPFLLIPDFDGMENNGPYLTKTEVVILRGINRRLSIFTISNNLEISIPSCHVYIESALKKLSVSTTVQAINKCIALRML